MASPKFCDIVFPKLFAPKFLSILHVISIKKLKFSQLFENFAYAFRISARGNHPVNYNCDAWSLKAFFKTLFVVVLVPSVLVFGEALTPQEGAIHPLVVVYPFLNNDCRVHRHQQTHASDLPAEHRLRH